MPASPPISNRFISALGGASRTGYGVFDAIIVLFDFILLRRQT